MASLSIFTCSIEFIQLRSRGRRGGWAGIRGFCASFALSKEFWFDRMIMEHQQNNSTIMMSHLVHSYTTWDVCVSLD